MAQQVVAERWVVQQSVLAWVRIIGIAVAAGLLYWVLSTLIGRYVIEPLACRDLVDAAAGVVALVAAGRVATVLVALASVFALIRFAVPRPIVVSVASAVVLWSLASFTQGLWWLETLAWVVGMYVLAYVLFGWIAKHSNPAVVIVVAVLAVTVITITQSL